METKALNFINDLLAAITSTPEHLWFTVGVVVASLPVTALIVEAYKKYHFKINGVEMENKTIDFVVLVTGGLMTIADFLITNGDNAAKFLPFLTVVLPTIKAFAPTVYTYSRAVHGWFVNRKSEDQKQRLQALSDNLNRISNTAGSMGTEAAGVVPVTASPAPSVGNDLVM